MKRILLFGATGRTGELVLKMALEKGYAVTGLVRNPHKINIISEDLTIITGSPANIADVRKAINDCDIVISTLSAFPLKESVSFRKIPAPHFLENSIRNAIICLKELGKKRIITLSSIGAGDSYPLIPWFMKLITQLTNFKMVFADHSKQEELLMHSELDWTIARPVGLNDDIQLKETLLSYDRRPKPFRVSRRQVAKFLVDSIADSSLIGKAPILSERA